MKPNHRDVVVITIIERSPAEVWDAWLPELEAILASFELVERRPEPEAGSAAGPSDSGDSA